MASEPVCGVTGANGYLGASVCRFFRARGWRVVELGRRQGQTPFNLGAEVPPDCLVVDGRPLDALVHCAYDFAPRRLEDIRRINVEGSRRLFLAAASVGVRRLIFVSSMAAYEGCRSSYGQAKLEVEKLVASLGGASVRPGLIYGENPGGMVGMLNRFIERSPVVPLIGAQAVVHTAHEEDVCAALFALATTNGPLPAHVISAIEPEGVRFRDLVRQLARLRRRRFVLVPVPPGLVWGLLRVAELLQLPVRMRSDSVVSFCAINPAPDKTSATALGVRFRPFAESFRPG